MKRLQLTFIPLCLAIVLGTAWANGQTTGTQPDAASTQVISTLEEQLRFRLRATAEDQHEYIRIVVEKVRNKELETRLVLAVERYAMRRNRDFPFPYFERALKFEASKRGVFLPTVKQVASSKGTTLR
jgi:hypothetical protein